MINNIDNLKEFILFAKANKLKRFKLADLEFEFSDINYIEELKAEVTAPFTPSNTGTLADTDNDKPITEDEDLFWSTST